MELTYSCFVVGNTLVVTCHGDLLGISLEKQLFKQASDLAKIGVVNCSADLSDVRYMNSKGLSLLIRMLTMFRNAGGDMILIQPNSKANKLLTITKLDKIFKAVDSRGDALKLLNN